MSILVMKFGGTSVANLNRIKNLYKLVKQKIDSGQKKLVIVVSAMSVVTYSLVKEFKKIDDEINNPEYDVVVSTGEQYSSAIIREQGSDYDLYMARKRKVEAGKDELRGAIREINNLKKELREIKSLIKEVIIK